MRDYLTLGYAVAPNTIFEGIRKLPPASMLIWERDGWRVETLLASCRRACVASVSEQEWTERIRTRARRGPCAITW